MDGRHSHFGLDCVAQTQHTVECKQHAMKKRIRITSIRRDPPDTTLLAQALIELVVYQREQERIQAEKAGQKAEGATDEPA